MAEIIFETVLKLKGESSIEIFLVIFRKCTSEDNAMCPSNKILKDGHSEHFNNKL